MIKRKEETETLMERQPQTGGIFKLDKLFSKCDKAKNIVEIANVTLGPDAEAEYHEHFGESEIYYIIEGVGLYNDNGTEEMVFEGDVTFTPEGDGHGMKNIGDDELRFVAITVLD